MTEYSPCGVEESFWPGGRAWTDQTTGKLSGPFGSTTLTVYAVACLTNSTLYFRYGLSAGKKDKILNALKTSTHPNGVFPRGTVIPLAKVVELRYSEKAGILEIHYGTKSRVAVKIKGLVYPIYTALRDRLAPYARPTSGKLTVSTDSVGCFVFLLCVDIVFIGILVFFLLQHGTVGPWKNMPPVRTDEFINVGPDTIRIPSGRSWLDDLKYVIGPPAFVILVAFLTFITAIVGGSLLYRLKHPYPTEVIVIEGGSSGAAPDRGSG
jgi:hypothetical protein